MAIAESAQATTGQRYSVWRVIGASAAGTVIEWYDFYIFGTLATTLAPRFYPPGDETVQLLLYLSTFAVGFVVRPFGALVFGRIGDKVGRKYAFLVTLLIMGTCTAAVGILPSYATIGYLAPALLILLRVLQGLALGGEYGGAVIYVAEHVPDRRRGFYTSFIQVTATLGLFVAIAVVIIVQRSMSKASFTAWGWRLPFLLSALLVGLSLYIRLRMQESPIFSALKAQGKTSTAPLRDAFRGWENWKRVLLTLFGATAGQGVIWYTGQFYALFYLTNILKVETEAARIVMAIGLVLGMPLFIVFGSLSDRVGRKKLMMTGCLAAAVFFMPIYHGMQRAAGTNVVTLKSTHDPITKEPKLSAVNRQGKIVVARSDKTYTDAVKAGAVSSATAHTDFPLLVLFIFIQVLFVAMFYGPLAAYLVEAFPASVRYTSLSLPYHIGSGVFGGLLPVIGLYVNAATKSVYAGLLYPIVVASITFVVGSLTLKEINHVNIWDEIDALGHGQVPVAEQPAPT